MNRFSAHMDRAWDLVARGKTIQALVAAKSALDVDRKSPEAHNLLGYIHAMDGDLEEALSNYQSAMDLDEHYVDPVLNSAELLSHPDADPEEAIRLCRNAIQMVSEPEELCEAILLEVDALLNLGRINEARERLEDIEQPDLLPSTYAMLVGRALYESGDIKSGKAYINRSLKQDPKNADAWYYYGLIARDEGRRIDAVTAFMRVLEKDLETPITPWAKHVEPKESLIRQAIALLDPEAQAPLENTEIVIQASPTEQQICEEVDPRQVVLIKGIDPALGAFKKMWIFSRNMARAGVMPNTIINDLAKMILQEAMPRQEGLV